MPVDFDGLVNTAVNTAFAETLRYTPQGGAAFDLPAIFDEAWATVAFKSSRFGAAMPVSTTKPCFGCRLADFPTGVAPAQDDTLVRVKTGDGFTVSDVQPDGVSGWVLISLN